MARINEPPPEWVYARCGRWALHALFVVVGVLFLVGWLSGCSRPPPPAPAAVDGKIEKISLEVPSPPGPAPVGARKYQATLTREARATWGLNAPVPLFGAQVEQESGWNANAQSPVGAQGLGQFMPKTAAWLGSLDPDVGQAQPLNPNWSLRALVRYDKLLYDHISNARDACNRHAFVLVGYNGGEGWRIKDQRAALASGRDATVYWGQVEQVNAGRSAAMWSENRGYPRRIIRTLQPRYATWGQQICQ